ncbi:beta-galactosidase [Leifsonia shinshuensis]|uniref:beta-galactosidase n=1 Tax=Leifsonia shinshuensis TaxID=150026 RepID=UPI001F51188C|nr:beta-galactosidase [Leifsonia shinshuensis]MCI0158744.1 beta-galactosidase [Leifsonia shinshuensis]
MSARPVAVEDGRIRIGDQLVPLIAGEIQFWRMDPAQWEPAVRAARDAGVGIVSTYLSWRRHEPTRGRRDFSGATDPRLDVRRFLEICRDLDVVVQLKPGPWICAEEPGGGYPDWLLADEGLLARDDQGEVVIGYNPPFLHPVPSYPSPAYLAHVDEWFGAVWEAIGDFAYPDGPVIALQLDNEPSSCFQDAMYSTDYSASSIAGFRRWLRESYDDDQDALRSFWADGTATFAAAEPPRRPETAAVESRRRLHDWIEYKTAATGEYLAALKRMHVARGGEALLYTVNLVTHPIHDVPVAHRAIRTIAEAITGEDHYYLPPVDVDDIHRLARSAATARAAGEPLPWIPELQAGIWRSPGEVVDYPQPTPLEQEVWWGAAFALGFAGANLYMLVNRENWEHAPLTGAGEESAFFRPVERLMEAEEGRPGLLAAPLKAPVVVAWHRADAYDAYAVAGTARVPEVPWNRPAAASAYRAWDETLLWLTERGIAYDLWETTTELALDPNVPLLIPDRSGIEAELVAAVRATGRQIITAGPETGWEHAELLAAAQPAVHGPQGRIPNTLVTTRDADDEQLIHIVHWGSGDQNARLELPATCSGRLRSLRDGSSLMINDHVTAIDLTAGHHVFALHPADAPAPTPPTPHQS